MHRPLEQSHRFCDICLKSRCQLDPADHIWSAADNEIMNSRQNARFVTKVVAPCLMASWDLYPPVPRLFCIPMTSGDTWSPGYRSAHVCTAQKLYLRSPKLLRDAPASLHNRTRRASKTASISLDIKCSQGHEPGADCARPEGTYWVRQHQQRRCRPVPPDLSVSQCPQVS